MNTVSSLWVTPHGLKKLRGERAVLREWLDRLTMRGQHYAASRKNKEIDLILSEKRVILGRLERLDSVLGRSKMLPETWGHKTEIHVGDTVYLRNHDHIRAVVLAAAQDADPGMGKVSATSPIGQALMGRHLGEHVRLNTLDGNQSYEILKLI